MKQFLIILGLCVAVVVGSAQSPLDQRVDFEVNDVLLSEALIQLGRVVGTPISFSNNILPTGRRVTISVAQKKLSTILTQLLRDSDVRFRAVGSQIILYYEKRKQHIFTISGFVEDQESGEKLINATVRVEDTNVGTVTNEYGFFSISLPEGNIRLVISYTGYSPKVARIQLNQKTKTNFSLKPNVTLREVIVTPELLEEVDIAEPLGADEISISLVEQLPTLGGEIEIFRAIENLPGVQSGADGLGGLHVRGGSADQNLILMDGVPIYNPSHSLGLFSVFNAEAIKSATLFKGAFPARYGGRLSSILDVRTREGNFKHLSGSVKAGLITSSVRFEGPIIKDKVSFLLTGRRTLLDNFIKNRTAKEKAAEEFFVDTYGVPLDGFSKYSFYDLNAKINFSASEKDKFFLSYYTGGDAFRDEDRIRSGRIGDFFYNDEEIQNYEWGNHIGVFRWNHLFGDKLFLNTTLTHSIYQFGVEQSLEIRISPTNPPFRVFVAEAYYSELKDWGTRLDFNYSTAQNHNIRFGWNSTIHTFEPGAFGTNARFNDSTIFQVNIDSFLNATRVSVHEHNIYIEDEFLLADKFRFNVGILGNAFVAEEKTFYLIQPRFSLDYQLARKINLQLGFSRMAQPLHLVTGSDAGFPNDLWLPATRLVPPQDSWQGGLGIQYQPTNSILMSVEGYYKKMDHLVTYLNSSSLRADISNPSNFTFVPNSTTNWESQFTVGEGWNYGTEFQIKKISGKMTGAINYTWAFANRRFPDLNEGEAFPYRYDRRHNLNLSFNYRFNRWLNVSSNWSYATGLSTLIPVSTFRQGGLTLINYDFARMPANHRLDAGITFTFASENFKHQIYLGAYNIYDRRNPQYYQLKSTIREGSDPNNPEIDYQIFEGSFLPFLPALSYTFSF
ncbi:MAG: TonB-dependent receptor [Bacteroidota bacterium]